MKELILEAFSVALTMFFLLQTGCTRQDSEQNRISRATPTNTQQHEQNIVSELIKYAIHNAELASGDYQKYLSTPMAQSDIEKIVNLTKIDDSHKDVIISTISENLISIIDDYRKTIKDFTTLPRERIRIQGIILSHRRQMGILISALQLTLSDPPEEYMVLVNDAERLLHGTL